MNQNLSHVSKKIDQQAFLPEIFDLNDNNDKIRINNLIKDDSIIIHNTIENQIEELIKIQNPSEQFDKEQLQQKTIEILNGTDPDDYGVWVYYPWSKRLVHLLDEEEFIAVRTSRNLYKITPQELEILRTKKIGIIGLSVGQTIAQTIATERICGELRLADFDNLDLSNLNRLSAGVQDLGIPKVIIAARKISEIDPYIKVRCWQEGINEENIDAFLSDGGNLDVLVEECDGLDVKILSRLKARSLKIPVVMDTNDRGTLDIERFDLEPARPIFHGKVDENISIKELKEMTNLEKLPLLDAMVGLSTVSERMKLSVVEIGKTIATWPQLASSVMLGGAMVADTCRRILLQQMSSSGRYNVDFDELIK